MDRLDQITDKCMTPHRTQYFILALRTQSCQKTFLNISAFKADLKLWRSPHCVPKLGAFFRRNSLWRKLLYIFFYKSVHKVKLGWFTNPKLNLTCNKGRFFTLLVILNVGPWHRQSLSRTPFR